MARYEPDECYDWKRKTLDQITAGESEMITLIRQIKECLPNARAQDLIASLEETLDVV